MSPESMGICLGLTASCLHLALSTIWVRHPSRRPAAVVRHALSALLAAIGVSFSAMLSDTTFNLWPLLAVLAWAAVCWLFIFSAVYKSLSLRILSHLIEHGDAGIPLEVITREHITPEFTARLAVLLQLGWAEQQGEDYRITAAGRRAAQRVRTLRSVFGLHGSGFYSDLRGVRKSDLRG